MPPLPVETTKSNVRARLLSKRFITDKGCWLWQGAHMKNGYGVIGMRVNGYSHNRLVHRAALWAFNDFPILSPLLVLHKCDTKLCFNPSHLFSGTQLDNIRDMWNKGRGPNQHHPRKLNSNEVRKIRDMYATGKFTHRSLAIEFCIGKSAVGQIVTGKAWSHIC